MLPDTRGRPINKRCLAALVAGFLALGSIGSTASAAGGGRSLALRSSTAAVTSPFTLIFQDDFNGTAVDTTAWSVFYGSGNGTNGPKARENTFIDNGHLVMRAKMIGDTWYGAGVSNAKRVVQTYGKYEFMVRFDAGKGVRTAALLWPKDGWPPEVDFYEISAMDIDRKTNLLANHYKPGNTIEHGPIKNDFTQWHAVGVEWTPRALNFTLDGAVVKTMTENVPQQPMWFGHNVALGGHSRGPDETTPSKVDVEIDWIKIYSYTP